MRIVQVTPQVFVYQTPSGTFHYERFTWLDLVYGDTYYKVLYTVPEGQGFYIHNLAFYVDITEPGTTFDNGWLQVVCGYGVEERFYIGQAVIDNEIAGFRHSVIFNGSIFVPGGYWIRGQSKIIGEGGVYRMTGFVTGLLV